MTETTVDRRMLFRGAGVAGALAVGGTALGSPANADGRHDDDHEDVTGSWLVTHSDDPPGEPNTGITAVGLAEGGVMTTQDIAPLAAGGVGSWKSRRGRFYGSYWTAAGTGTPTDPMLAIRIDVKGKARHDSMWGTYAVTAYDASNPAQATTTVLFTGTGTFTGERIDAWPH